MNVEQQVPRNALIWMILSLFALILPHIERVPLWVIAVYVVAAVWRIQVFRGLWAYPRRWLKLVLILAASGGVFFSFGSVLGLEPTVALLLTAFALKMIELSSRKDAYVLIFLGYFVCITEFLFSQDILIVGYSLFTVLLLTTALVALHQPGQQRFNRGSMKLAGTMLLQAFPLMLVLFFLFPRIGPLWTVPIKSHTAKTGMSDFLKPGDVSKLSQSAEVAFRVQFDGEIPAFGELYWRGLVMSRLEEGAWRSLRYWDVPAAERRMPELDAVGEPLSYAVIMEPTQQNWLFSLRYSQPASDGLLMLADYRLYSPIQIEHETQYRVQSWPQTPLDPELSAWRRETELALPAGDNPRTRELARSLRAASVSDADFVDRVLGYFTQQGFVYTLEPPLLGDDDPMDDFLFDSLRGFCEHYAYAFVMMMREAGVPARIVAGYMGGEINPVNRTVIVHQFDAHAWAEVWLAEQGWVRVDPTAAVAPDRIEWGLEQAVEGEGTFLSASPLSPLRYRDIDWVNALRLRYDALTYRWQAWVTGFNQEQQFDLLSRWLGEVSPQRFATVLLLTWAAVLVPVAAVLLLRRRRHQLSPADKHYLAFCERMARMGVVREPWESPADFAQRAMRKLPRYRQEIEAITEAYQDLTYRPAPAPSSSGETLASLRRSVRKLQFVR